MLSLRTTALQETSCSRIKKEQFAIEPDPARLQRIMAMTQYATHRFSVGQQVARTGNSPGPCEVKAQIAGRDGPEYRVRSLDGGFEAVVEERELTYSPASASTGPCSLR